MSSTTLSEQKAVVGREFDRIARGYDLLCKLNPGYHRHLRKSARRLKLRDGARILDLCCGTGLSTAALKTIHPNASITALDASAGMLDFARRKPELADVRWLHGDATDPELAGVDGKFDAIFVAYGIRNVPDADLALKNWHALLNDGGRICLHEYSVRDSRFAQAIWNLVSWTVVIPLGLLLTGTSSIFTYLRRSVLDFDGAKALKDRMRSAGFEAVENAPMDGWQRGIVHSFLGRKGVSS